MFETSGSLLSQQHPPLGSSAFRNCMISPLNIRQPEVLPASTNPFRVPSNSAFNEFGNSEKSLANNGYGPFGYSEQRKFLVFDQSGNETRLVFSSLCPVVQNLPVIPTTYPIWNPQVGSAKKFDERERHQARKDEQMCTKTPVMSEESGENEILDEECEMRENTDEINALLYSDSDDGYDDEDDEEVSSGRSPLAKQDEQQESDFDDEEVISSIYSKKRKIIEETIKNGHEKTSKENLSLEKINSGEFTSELDEGTSHTVGNKRPRKDKVRETLKVLESIIPGLRNKDPVSILDEAISYLKCLKYNAQNL